MNTREQALKNQVRKAQDLIRQFEEGTGRHNSNLIDTTHDAGARINLADERLFTLMAAELIRRYDTLESGPTDDLERHLVQCGMLCHRPEDCRIGQVVRLETIDRDPRERWASVAVPIGPVTYIEGDETFAAQAATRFEFERVKFCYNISVRIEREFWKRVA